MNKAGKILAVNPPYAIPGGEVSIECENFQISDYSDYGCFFDGQAARIVAASSKRVLAIVPEVFDTADVEVYLESGGMRSEPFNIKVGKKLADGLHLVANPAVDPKDNSIIVTRSGSRGQKLPVTLLRLETDGYLSEMQADVMNPTGIAFDRNGEMFVTNRADGEVYRVSRDDDAIPVSFELGIATGIAFDRNGELFVTNRADGEVYRVSRDDDAIPVSFELGIATGIAFDREGEMFVGDRSGTIYRVKGFDASESFAILEPSVSAFHLAFAPDGRLFVTAPKLSSFDAVYAFDSKGYEAIFARGLGRPQGLAFDNSSNLYVGACFEGRHGIVKISPNGTKSELFVAGMNIVGLCFTRKGELIAATNDAIYSLPIGIYGTLLD